MISMVVPAYNEEKRIKTTISDLRKVKGVKEIIVVCNGCTDRTSDVARSLKTKVIEISEKDKGSAVITGLKKAKHNLIGFVDSDGAFSSKSINKIVSEISVNDAVIASKWKGRKFNSVNGSFERKFTSRIWNLLTKILLGLEFSDTQAGLKIMRKSVFDKIDKNFACRGFAFDAELLYKIKKAGGKVKEVYVPVRHIKNMNGKDSSFSVLRAPGMLKGLLKFWFNENTKNR